MAGPVDFETENVTVSGAAHKVGDLKIVSGDFVLVDDAERVAQSVEIRMRAFRGEWFLDRTFGLPWFQSVLGGKMISSAEYDAVVKATILEVEEVNRITSFSSEFDRANRKYSVEFVADTIYGPIEYEGVVP